MSRIDPETLAALMEGRLSDEERARVLSELAGSEADLEVLADAAIAAAALEEETVEPELAPVVPAPVSPARARAGLRWKAWLPVAAAVAAVALIPSLLDRTDDAGLAPLRLELLALGPVTSPADLPAAAGGDAVRSGGPSSELLDALTPVARSFRRGAVFARLTVLAPSARVGSPEAAALDALLRSASGGAARPTVQAWLGDGADAESTWRAAAEALRQVEGAPAAFRLGLRVEGASLSGPDAPRGTAVALDWAEALEGDFMDLPPDARAALEGDFRRLRERAVADPAPEDGTFAEALEAFAAAVSGLRDPPGPGA